MTAKRNLSGEFTRADGSQRSDRKPRWTKRNRIGEFVNASGFNRSSCARLLDEWHRYIESRLDYADAFCRGLVSRRFFVPGASLRLASQELRDWFEVNGPIMSFATFSEQSVERECEA